MSTAPDVEGILPQVELIEEDGEPLESAWHRLAMTLLIEVVTHFLRHRQDFYVGGNMFLYFSTQQARNRDFRGPDFFLVNGGVRRSPPRRYWAVWNEGGRYPDVVVELLSPTTASEDRTTKKDVYERVFRTAEYYCYDPDTRTLEGWRLARGSYEPIAPDEHGRLWCEELGLWLGTWEGVYLEERQVWLRFFDAACEPVPTPAEAALLQGDIEKERADEANRMAEEGWRRADEERVRAEDERRRADEEATRAQKERSRADKESRRADEEAARAQDERRRAEALEGELAQLRARLTPPG